MSQTAISTELRAKDITDIRNKLQLSVDKAATLVGVPADLFANFESRKSVPARQTQDLLRLFDARPDIAKRILDNPRDSGTAEGIAKLCANLNPDQVSVLTARLIRLSETRLPPVAAD